MSARYMLIDASGNTYTLPEKIVLRDEDAFTIDIDPIEKSFRDGAVYPGLIRLKSKELVFEYPSYKKTDALFRAELNNLFAFALKTVIVRDIILNIQTEVLPEKFSAKYEKGGFLRTSDNSITFTQLIPFWEDVLYTTHNIIGVPGGTSGQLVINHNSFAETPLLITFSSPTSLIDSIILLITENNQGLTLQDPAFGNNNSDILIIDSKIGSITLNGVKRNQYIISNTGFITLPLLQGTLQYNCNGNVGISIQYKKRYFV